MFESILNYASNYLMDKYDNLSDGSYVDNVYSFIELLQEKLK